MSSLSRGTPNVTFLAPTPAKWKVFNVICVAGSPTLCAASTPTTSPGLTQDLLKRCLISPRSQSKDCLLSSSFSMIFREPRCPRRCAWRMILALSSTSRPMVSPSAMARVTSSCERSSSTFRQTSIGEYLSFRWILSSSEDRALARFRSLSILMGMCCRASLKTWVQMSSFSFDNLFHSSSSVDWLSALALMSVRTSGGSHVAP
mmetsp:Transcript_10679/g.24018  ORF Transcript_10679/g.24018 Transcript_10679/m.24018 type:complete len:204 (-) Transcript_10679:1085-1696(-)